MAHILYGDVKRVNESDDAYYGVASQVGILVNKRAHRTDITAVIGSEAGMGAPACFIPSLAEMHVNTEMVPLGAPDKVDLNDALWCLEHAPAVGAMEHEAAHARHTTWDPRDLMETYGATRKMLDVITTLEEPRIEAAAMRRRPASLPFLRGCAMEIVGRDFHIPDTRYGAAAAAALLLARVDAKVLTRAETKTFRTDILAVLDEDTLAALEVIWQGHFMLRDNDYEGMVANAREWLDVLGEDPDDSDGMVGEGLMGEGMPGDPSDGEGEGDGEGSDSGSEGSGFGESIKRKAASAETRIDKEIVERRGDERAARRMAEREADKARKGEGDREHAKAFSKSGRGGLTGYSSGGFSHLSHRRAATSDERRAARMLASALERIDYRDRAVTKVASVVPPGRLRGRAAVQAEAARSKGQDGEVAVWVGKRRRKVESTPLTIGFAGDVSGSMSSAMEPLASAQWVLSTAGAHIDATVASVHFGARVHGITPAGVREKDVRVFDAYEGTEAFKSAALTLDRELNLLDGTGARILFVASDGVFVNDVDKDYASTFVRLAARKGVAVIFLSFTGSMAWGSYGAAVIDCTGKSPAEVATLCGKAAIAEVRRIDARV